MKPFGDDSDILMPLWMIHLGPRLRRSVGPPDKMASLAASTIEHGLYHPLLVRSDGRLVCGWRRLEAMRSLGWKLVPVVLWEVADDEIHDMELAENTREPLTEKELAWTPPTMT